MTDLFKEKSKDWDKNSRRQMLSSGIANSIIKNIALNNQMHVLDFGAGTGLITSVIAPYVKK